jgi:hypothetical protein
MSTLLIGVQNPRRGILHMVHDFGFGDESRDGWRGLRTFRVSGSHGGFLRVQPSDVGTERGQLALWRDGSGNGAYESALEGVGRRKLSQDVDFSRGRSVD